MKIAVICLLPEMLSALEFGIPGRAQKNGLFQLAFYNPRDYTTDRHHTVDDKPYGGGPGMVMMVEPILSAINAAKIDLGQDTRVIYLSPQGKQLNQNKVSEFARSEKIIFLAGRYEGIDERVISACVDEEWSLGDYVLSGGELAAMVIVDAISRLLPGALGEPRSAVEDSFTDGLLDYPHYTRPDEVAELKVPPVLLSGDHRAILRWRKKQALGRTWLKRPDLLATKILNYEQQDLLAEFINEYQNRVGVVKDE